NNDFLFKDHGYTGSASLRVDVKRQLVNPGEKVSFTGLSQIPYSVEFSGPGLITQEIEINPNARGSVKGGKVILKAAPQLDFTFKTRVRQVDGSWKEAEKLTTVTVVCDGDEQLLFSDTVDKFGTPLRLRLDPEEAGVRGSFFYYDPKSFVKIGKGKLKNSMHWEEVDRSEASPDTILQPGHTYLFQKHNLRGIDVELLFSVRQRNVK
ncbi:MAG: hypothetical protein AAF226_13465, partial [Verrucomicrobiota bacterium]